MAITQRATDWYIDAVNLAGGLPASATDPATNQSVLIASTSALVGSEALTTALATLSTNLTALNTSLTTLNSNMSTLNSHLNDLKGHASTAATAQSAIKTLSETTGVRTEGAYTTATLPTLYKLLVERGVLLEEDGALSEGEQQRAADKYSEYVAKAKTTFNPFE
jgi:uncharacterized phage infection (PIP) family protein YhgE